jgi:hypothetical protein
MWRQLLPRNWCAGSRGFWLFGRKLCEFRQHQAANETAREDAQLVLSLIVIVLLGSIRI